MQENISLQIPGSDRQLHPGDIVKLGRFSTEPWVVGFGWFSFGGNRPFCGWYLTSATSEARVKPLQLPDLDDIYLIESGQNCS